MLYLLIDLARAADEAAPGFSLQEIWEASGPIARGTIVTLVFMLLASIYVSLERLLAFTRARNQSMQLASTIVSSLQTGDVTKALATARDEQYKASYLASLLRAGLAEIAEHPDEFGLANAERAVTKAMGEEQGRLRRGLPILATVGSTAPFVGLFGTVFGVINAFKGMSSGAGGLGPVSKGISEALITTGVGIGVAIVGVWCYNYFNSRLDKVSDEMTASSSDFSDWAHKQFLGRGSGAQASK